ncbi:sensor histidine kinase [Sulfuriflexus mobilis]|uniref:sensor histidine kinase n=1 Tax=Sulfuriflexus mobilis TaxID=1811807 RepID=UPI000F81FB93|nr:ATP-binding protein [Sulfuriflexus mobilis]
MKLPFRYQFILAPFIIVVLLACLVAYTLLELSYINKANEITRQWAIISDRAQTAISSARQLNTIIRELSSEDIQQDEQFFSYLEQTRILSDSLHIPYLLEQVSPELRQLITDSGQLLREPEHVRPEAISLSLERLLPALEYQAKIFTAQRRTTFIDNHHKLVAISSRLTTVLLTALIICISLATGLALWGLTITRRRLKRLTQRAHDVCTGDSVPLPAPVDTRDELDDLELCLANMTTRLLQVVSVENVLLGVEGERRRIAMDMHDGVLADLTAINRRLDKLNTSIAKQGGIKNDEINAMRADVDNVIDNLRCTIDDLHPQVLETLGLESALHSYIERHRGRDGMTASFQNVHFEFDQRIDSSLSTRDKINLFRIIAEAINNVIKHAQGDRLEISLRIVQDKIIACIEDNGIGMPKEIRGDGHGCANISERARLIGAKIQWRTSRFSQGTCFELSLRLKQ